MKKDQVTTVSDDEIMRLLGDPRPEQRAERTLPLPSNVEQPDVPPQVLPSVSKPQGDTIFEAPGIMVTKTMFHTFGMMYPINGITSIRWQRIPPNIAPQIILIVLGMVLCAISVSVFATSGIVGGAALILLGLCCIFLAVTSMSRARSTYAVIITTAGRDVQALLADNENLANKVLIAIQQAVALRG